MTRNKALNVPIRQYLEQLGIYPAKDKTNYGMYHSPFREDRTASMKVDYTQNLWIDYGTGEGGSVIDLVMKMNRCDFQTALKHLNNNELPEFTPTPAPSRNSESSLTVTSVKELGNPALLSYLNSRCIDIGIAKLYCKEIYYRCNGKPYFAIGFPNDNGGWELRNANFKGCVSPKSITTINRRHSGCMVFEGFSDFLSYLSLKKNPYPLANAVILNSVTNLNKALPFLREHKTVYAFLDNDKAGRRTFSEMEKALPNVEVIDQSLFYGNYKDLSDYLTQRSKQVRQQPPTLKPKGIKMR